MSKRIIFYDPEIDSEVEFKVISDFYEKMYSEVAFLAESGTNDVRFEKRPLTIKRKNNVV